MAVPISSSIYILFKRSQNNLEQEFGKLTKHLNIGACADWLETSRGLNNKQRVLLLENYKFEKHQRLQKITACSNLRNGRHSILSTSTGCQSVYFDSAVLINIIS